MLLEVTGHFVEAVPEWGEVNIDSGRSNTIDSPVVQIVDKVGRVEELGNSGVDVLLRLVQCINLLSLLRVILVVEGLSVTSIGTVVVDEGVLALPVLLSKDL